MAAEAGAYRCLRRRLIHRRLLLLAPTKDVVEEGEARRLDHGHCLISGWSRRGRGGHGIGSGPHVGRSSTLEVIWTCGKCGLEGCGKRECGLEGCGKRECSLEGCGKRECGLKGCGKRRRDGSATKAPF